MSENGSLVIGLGNPILGDDGVGWRVADEVRALLEGRPEGASRLIEVECLSAGGLTLMERMAGYRRVIVLDSIVTGQRPMGSLFSGSLSELPNHASGHSTSAHDTSLQNALKAGRELGLELPEDIWVVAVESRGVTEFSEKLSPAVEAAVLPAAAEALRLLEEDPG